MMSYLTLSLSNTSTFCWLMRLFLSNSGSLMSCILTTSCILRHPAKVLTSLVSPSNFVMTPFGKADLLIIDIFKPESKSTRKSLWLLVVPIVSAVQMVWHKLPRKVSYKSNFGAPDQGQTLEVWKSQTTESALRWCTGHIVPRHTLRYILRFGSWS